MIILLLLLFFLLLFTTFFIHTPLHFEHFKENYNIPQKDIQIENQDEETHDKHKKKYKFTKTDDKKKYKFTETDHEIDDDKTETDHEIDDDKTETDHEIDDDKYQFTDDDINEIEEVDNNVDLNINYNTKKYYCNRYEHHKQLDPDVPSKIYLSKKKKNPHFFKKDDICCVQGNDPKLNFRRGHVKCCYFRNTDQKSIPKCNKYNLT